MSWEPPAGGGYLIAVPSYDYSKTCDQVEAFFGRPLNRYSYQIHHEGQSYVVFNFFREEAERCIAAFNGEWFDPRDKGRGVHWTKWYKGRAAKRERNRSPYDFR